jgi:MtN3 and saliva related transmembrane protein
MKYIGFIAAFLTTGSFLPQAVKTIKSKNTKSISLGMYLLFVIGAFLWLVYGLLIEDTAVIVANGITTLLSGIILFFKLRDKFGKKE